MRRVAYVRRGARAGISVLVMGATCALAQQAPDTAPPASTEQSPPAATSTESATPPAAASDSVPPASAAAPTSNLPELVVNDDGNKKKKAAKAKQEPAAAPTTSGATAEAAEKPPTTTLGTAAPADIGTTTFDAGAVQMRTNGGGDANTFLRNLPNVQYQSQGARSSGSNAATTVDTKPAEISISGGRTYENNFIINGVQANNILGNKERNGQQLNDTLANPAQTNPVGTSTQTIYVPSDFIGDATVIDSNASAEYGQFQGGVVIYNLTPAPFDRYHASVSASKEDSDWATYENAYGGTAAVTAVPPSYTKSKLSASLGAPLTNDFAVIGQVSRQEADTSIARAIWAGPGTVDQYSDNVFMRFSAVAKTDIGKITLDTSRTDYFQHWENWHGTGLHYDIDTTGTISKLEHESKLPGVRDGSVGLGNVRIKSRATLNTMDTENNSDSNVYWARTVQRLINRNPLNPSQFADEQFNIGGACTGSPKINGWYTSNDASSGFPVWSGICQTGGYGTFLSSQTDYGLDTAIDGDLLWGKFKLGGDVKHYDGSQGRPEDYAMATGNWTVVNNKLYSSSSSVTNPTQVSYSTFTCNTAIGCDPNQVAASYLLYRAYNASAQVNAVHGFAELDQTLGWFNMRAGVRVDYDDYMENINVAPRTALTVKPFDGLSATIGYNQYYLGESLYYAVRSKVPQAVSVTRFSTSTGPASNGVINDPAIPASTPLTYRFDGLDTPYTDEYTAGANVRDPVLDGLWRFRYLERYGHDQFSTALCPGFTSNCYVAGNNGSTNFRSASAEYTKNWNGLKNDVELNAVGVTGSVTWSEQGTRGSSYVVNYDPTGDGVEDTAPIKYNGNVYSLQSFSMVTGNLDIPVRFGATLSTVWFGGVLELNANAGVNLGYEGVGPTTPSSFTSSAQDPRCVPNCTNYIDRQFNATLKLDLSGRVNVTDQAYIEFFANNITSSSQNALITSTDSPWVLARTFWIGSGLKF